MNNDRILQLCADIEETIKEAANVHDIPWLYYEAIKTYLEEIRKEITENG